MRNNLTVFFKFHELKDFVGCNHEEIKTLEKVFKGKLPNIYKEFLRAFGKTTELFSDMQYTYDIVYKLNLKRESHFPADLPAEETVVDYDNLFIIGYTQGVLHCIDVTSDYSSDDVNDCALYSYAFTEKEEDFEPSDDGGFTDFMKENMDDQFGSYRWVVGL